MRIKETNKAIEYLKIAVIIALVLMVARLFMFRAFLVADNDMEDTIRAGDLVFVNMLSYKYSSMEPGDLVLINNPIVMGKNTIRRVVATGGQVVEIRDKTLYVDSVAVVEPSGIKFSDEVIYPEEFALRDNFGPVHVPSGQVFVMADNRDSANDSRLWKSVPVDDIIGEALVVVLSWKPDPDAPRFESPYIIPLFEILWHDIIMFPGRIDWGRVGAGLR
jgi:signal peptidase I